MKTMFNVEESNLIYIFAGEQERGHRGHRKGFAVS